MVYYVFFFFFCLGLGIFLGFGIDLGLGLHGFNVSIVLYDIINVMSSSNVQAVKC